MTKNSSTWICPLCYKRCEYGTMGCSDPTTCPEPKNINYMGYEERSKKQVTKGVGISEIANEEGE